MAGPTTTLSSDSQITARRSSLTKLKRLVASKHQREEHVIPRPRRWRSAKQRLPFITNGATGNGHASKRVSSRNDVDGLPYVAVSSGAESEDASVNGEDAHRTSTIPPNHPAANGQISSDQIGLPPDLRVAGSARTSRVTGVASPLKASHCPTRPDTRELHVSFKEGVASLPKWDSSIPSQTLKGLAQRSPQSKFDVNGNEYIRRSDLEQTVLRLIKARAQCEAIRGVRDRRQDEYDVSRDSLKTNLESFQKATGLMRNVDQSVQYIRAAAAARTANSEIKVMQKKQYRLESICRKLRSREYKMEKHEKDVLKLLYPAYDNVDVLERSLNIEADDSPSGSSESSGSGRTSGDEDEEDFLKPQTSLQQYRDIVGHITLHRERLQELEFSFQKRSRKSMRSEMNPHQIQDAHESYTSERTTQVLALLRSIDSARELSKICLDKPNSEAGSEQDDDIPGLLEDALRYDVGQGAISQMYSLHWVEEHHGIRPIELLLVPVTQPSARVSTWIIDTSICLCGMNAEETRLAVETADERKVLTVAEHELWNAENWQDGMSAHVSNPDRVNSYAASSKDHESRRTLYQAAALRKHWGDSWKCSHNSEPDIDTGRLYGPAGGKGTSHSPSMFWTGTVDDAHAAVRSRKYGSVFSWYKVHGESRIMKSRSVSLAADLATTRY